MSEKKEEKMTLDDLTKGNIWSVMPGELIHMLIEGKKSETFPEMETHYMNIIRAVFDIQFLNRKDEKKVELYESQNYEIYPYTTEGECDAIAIRKRPIKKITDLSLENVQHIDTVELLELIKNNMGTGWKGLALSIQDIIESAFFVDCCVMPAAIMHKVGGIIDSRKEDGYDILEIDRAGWIEGIFVKPKPKVEKVRMDFRIKDDDLDEENFEEEEEDDDDDDLLEDEEDKAPNEEDEEEEDEMEESTPEIEDIEGIDIDDDDE